MCKIAKFINSALNNSSANEAAQALKMAAATMQKEGVNPASLLQEKGADSSERVAELEIQLKDLEVNKEYWYSLWDESSDEVIALKDEVEELKANLEFHRKEPSQRKELTEAKTVAVRWANDCKAAQKALKASEMASVAYQGAIKAREVEIESWRDECARLNRVLSSTVCEYETKLNQWRWIGVGVALIVGVAIRMATW